MIEIRKIECISYDKEDEMYDTRKTFVGDIVRLFYRDKSKGFIDGEILSINNTDKSIVILAGDGYKHTIKISSLSGCDVCGRGRYFRAISGI